MHACAISRTQLALLGIFLIALGVRFAYLRSDPHPRYGVWQQGGMAHNIVADGHWFQINMRAHDFVGNPYFTTQPPGAAPHLIEPADVDLRYADAHPLWVPEVAEPVGESVVLAGLWEVTGSERFLPEQILRIALDALAALLVYRIAMRLFERRRGALLAAALYAVYPPIAHQTISPYEDYWAVPATISIVAAYLEAVCSAHRWRWLIACGVLTGLGCYFRPNILILPAVLALALAPRTGLRRALHEGLVVTAIAALLLVPWTIRNYDVFHKFIPVRNAGFAMWEGLGELPNSFGAVENETVINAEVHRVHPNFVFESPAWDAVLKHWSIQTIERHPPFYLELLARRAALATVWSFDHSWMHRGTISPLAYGGGLLSYVVERPADLLQTALAPAVFVFAMLTLGLTWRRWRAQHAVLIAVVLATLIPYILIHVEFRYLPPASFAYLVWIGLGASMLAERLGAPPERAAAHPPTRSRFARAHPRQTPSSTAWLHCREGFEVAT
jgi:Dolichyl-phosphate-mannose-protein mannosyltransferase